MILLDTPQTRSLEDPSVSLLSWPNDNQSIIGSGSDAVISRDKALTYSPVWRAVQLVSSTVGKVPCHLLKAVANGKDKEKADPLYRLLTKKPNSEQTAMQFFSQMMLHCLLDPGNGYAYIDRDAAGKPVQLIPLEPQRVTPVRRNGKLYYLYHYDGEKKLPDKLLAENVLHFKGMGYDGLVGYSVLQYATNSFGMGLSAQKYSNKFYQNSAEPRVILEYPQWMKADQVKTTRKMWNSMHQGLDNAHKTAILMGGAKATPLSLSARDSQLIESLEWSIRDVANWFGVPAHKIGDNSKSAYNSLEQENQSFLDDTIDVWFVIFEEELEDKLLTEDQKRSMSHLIEYERKALVRANLAARATYYRAALAGAAWHAVNEVRAAENLNAMEGYDEILQPSNNFGSSPDNSEAEDLARGLLGDTTAAMTKRLVFNYEKHRKKHGHSAEQFILLTRKHADIIRAKVSAPAKLLACVVDGNESDITDHYVQQVYEQAKEEVGL